MCIRDSYLGDKGLGGFVTVKVNTDEGISGFGEAGLAYGKCSEAAFGQCQDFARMVLGMDPVSYTHLDVYKRQPDMIAP